jgi:mono/diheme cytochrome c family protein
VPNLQPALIDSPVAAGDPAQLIRVVLLGPAKVLPANREPYSNTMPAFPQLSDGEISAVLTYIRHQFASQAPAITASEIAAQRGS